MLHTRRESLWRIMGCCAAGGALGTGLWPLRAAAQRPAGPARDAWAAAQQAIGDASRMAARITSSLDGLTATTAQALAAKERLQRELRKLADEIAALTAERDRLMEEYRNGLFCSGCGRTKSQILAKGETFPHSGQTIVRPTPQQIAAKERELQAPIDRGERQADAHRKDLAENSRKADAGLDQIRAGLDLWRTAVTYWNGAVRGGLRERQVELEQAVAEFQAALEAELRRQAQRGPADTAQADAEAAVWRRLLDQQKAEIDAFRTVSHKTLLDLTQRRRQQQGTIADHIRRSPLDTSLLGRAAVDAPIDVGTSPHELGVRYLLGRLPRLPGPMDPVQPQEILPDVAAFVAAFKSSELPMAPPALASAAPLQPAAAPQPPAPAANRLLQALP